LERRSNSPDTRRRSQRERISASNGLLICDTDAFATSIWHRRYLGERSPAVEALADSYRPDLYLLTDASIPFVQDGTRDGEQIREWMHATFVAELVAHGRPYVTIAGTPGERLARAVAAIDRLVLRRLIATIWEGFVRKHRYQIALSHARQYLLPP